MSAYKAASYGVRRTVRDAKRRYRERLKSHFHQGDTRSMWQGLRTITHYKIKDTEMINAVFTFANELNEFFAVSSEVTDLEGGGPKSTNVNNADTEEQTRASKAACPALRASEIGRTYWIKGGRSQSPSTVSQQQNNSQTSDQKHSEAGYNTLLSGTAHIYESVDAAANKDIRTDSVSESTEHIYAEIELESTKKQKKKKENKENKTESPDCFYSKLMLQTDQGGRSQSPSTVSQQQNNSQTSDQKHSEAGYNTLLSDSVSESTELTYAEIELKSTKKQKKKKENKENKTESPDCFYSKLTLKTDQDHQKDETLNSTAAGANETKQGDNVSITVDTNNNELEQPSADQPETSSQASASSPALHSVDIPEYTSTDPGTWGEINDKVREYWAERGPQICQNMTADFSGSEQQYKNQKR
ncbi:immunoglobulin superfamily member 1-like isoform X3 [Labeo rohita]|nr:immunoglobulin superfamily member 1-like isoform X3 [Labeo rohita]